MKTKSLLAILIGVLLIVALTGCFSKQALTSDEFSSKMQGLGFSIVDASAQYSQFDHINKVLLAVDPTTSFQIEFYDINSDSNALGVYNTNFSTMENSRGSSSSYSTVSMGNYNRATQESNGEYWVLSRVSSTFVYVHSDVANKASINSALDTIGY